MFLQTIKRRYTPPTCTLEVTAQRSLLSRWQKEPIPKNVQFELRFDDPRNFQTDPISIKGDRAQLDHLCELVSTYIQNFLSPTNNPPLFIPFSSPDDSISSFQPAAAPPAPALASSRLAKSSRFISLPERPPSPSLQPRSLLNHDLILGTLATSESGTQVSLSTSQLYDLATALEQYSNEVEQLPKVAVPVQPIPVWAKTAALFIVALGVTTAVLRVTQQEEEEVVVTNEGQPPPIIQSTPERVLPAPPDLPPLNPEFPDELANRPPINPPDSVEAPNGEEDEINRIFGPGGTVIVPRNSGSASPGGSGASGVPGQPGQSGSGVSPSITNNRPGAVSPSITNNRPGPVPPPITTNTPEPVQPESARVEPDLSDVLPRPRSTPNVPNLPPVTSGPIDRPTRSSAMPPVAIAPRQVEESESFSAQSSTPQTQQVQDYFQQRWQPPENLEETLEYRLRLNQQGQLERIIPLNDAAKEYLDQTGMPRLGQPFVSPLQGRNSLQVKLRLGADGRVESE